MRAIYHVEMAAPTHRKLPVTRPDTLWFFRAHFLHGNKHLPSVALRVPVGR